MYAIGRERKMAILHGSDIVSMLGWDRVLGLCVATIVVALLIWGKEDR